MALPGSTVNGLPDVAEPPGVTTVIAAVWAVAGTVKVMVVAFTTVKVAATVPTTRLVALVRLVPVRVMVTPGIPLVGEKLASVGAAGGASSFLQPASHRLPKAALAPV